MGKATTQQKTYHQTWSGAGKDNENQNKREKQHFRTLSGTSQKRLNLALLNPWAMGVATSPFPKIRVKKVLVSPWRCEQSCGPSENS